MIETILHEREIQQLLNEKKLQAQEVQSNTIQALNVDLVIIGNNGSGKENCRTKTPCSKSVKDSSLDSATKDKAVGQNHKCKMKATGQQHIVQPGLNNEGGVDQYTEQCQVKSPLLDPLHANQTTELSNQSLESENICLKKTIAQFQKDFLRMEAHCIALELKCQNQSLKSGQHG
ncbi:hypothetical protein Tco_0161540 [Tanacetum coccineum]